MAKIANVSYATVSGALNGSKEVSEKIKTFASPDAADKIAAALLGQPA